MFSGLLFPRHNIAAGPVHAEALESLDSHPSRPQCGAHQKIGDEYDVRMHVIALFIMFMTSSLASCGPLYLRRVIEKGQANTDASESDDEKEGSSNNFKNSIIIWFQWFLWTARHFGTGVIIGTAFIHLLPGAHEYLTDPCLPEFFTETYRALPEAISMVGAFTMFLIDFFSKRWIGHLQKRALEKDGAMIAVAAGIHSHPSKGPILGG